MARIEVKIHKHRYQKAKKRVQKICNKLKELYSEDGNDTPAYDDEQILIVSQKYDQVKTQKRFKNEEQE